MILEVCSGNRESAINAAKAGAQRIELCSELSIGGLTPSYDDIRYCVSNLALQTFVLIRPRGGDFCYNESEFQQILTDIQFCREAGAHGVVVGFLNKDLSINLQQCKKAMETAGTLPVTFHRAFDRCANWPLALEQIIECGFSRILTSGQQPTALEGTDTLSAIVKQAAKRITILAGSGVNSQNVAELIHRSHADEVHGSCKLNGNISNIEEIKKTLEIINHNKTL